MMTLFLSSAAKNHLTLWLGCSALTLCLAGCDIAASDSWHETEVRRITAPDKRYDLVYFEASGGATTGVYSKVYLMPVGEKDKVRGQLILETRGKDPVTVKWLPDSRAAFLLRDRRFEHFTNYGYILHGNDMPGEVRFVLKWE